jgi:hypothetical protein
VDASLSKKCAAVSGSNKTVVCVTDVLFNMSETNKWKLRFLGIGLSNRALIMLVLIVCLFCTMLTKVHRLSKKFVRKS